MWKRHWGLDRDPFGDRGGAFVALPGHVEAVARLVHAIESAGRSARLVARPGLGKSMVLARALETTRSPTRRVARVTGPGDGAELFASLASGLGARVAPGLSRPTAWRILVESARLCRWQGLHVVLSVDDCDAPVDHRDLDRLDHLDPDPSALLTVLRVGRGAGWERAESTSGTSLVDWGLAIRLAPLTRSEASVYLAARLEAAGRLEPCFTPRALTRLHALSGGVPRGLDRLATLALMASSVRGLEMVTPEVVDASARECMAFHPTPTVA